MKIVSVIARYLLGLMFTVFGLNGFLNFIHQPPPTNPLAIQFFVAISASHFAAFFFAVQLIGGLLLLSGFFVPLALTVLAAELYNILAFHLTLCAGEHRSGAGRMRAVGRWSSCSTATASTAFSPQSLWCRNSLLRCREAQCLLAAEHVSLIPQTAEITPKAYTEFESRPLLVQQLRHVGPRPVQDFRSVHSRSDILHTPERAGVPSCRRFWSTANLAITKNATEHGLGYLPYV